MAQRSTERRFVVEVLSAFPGKLATVVFRLIYKAMIFELFLTCGTGTNYVLAAND